MGVFRSPCLVDFSFAAKKDAPSSSGDVKAGGKPFIFADKIRSNRRLSTLQTPKWQTFSGLFGRERYRRQTAIIRSGNQCRLDEKKCRDGCVG